MNDSSKRQPIRDYKDLHVWQKAMELAKYIYLLSSRFPSKEKFGLVSQLRRAAVSVPSECHLRSSQKHDRGISPVSVAR
jgi:hypothetical protein